MSDEALMAKIEALIREAVRDELRRGQFPNRHEQVLMTVRECATKYRCGYQRVMRAIRLGHVRAVERPAGKNGRPQKLLLVEDAQRHFGAGMA